MTDDQLSRVVREAVAHYPFSDTVLFFDAYRALIQESLEGKTVVEVCCGQGQLAGWLARVCPGAKVYGIDYWDGHTDAARERFGDLQNLTFRSGDALRLDEFPDGSVDLVVGQATMHHLANNLPGAAREFSRVLKAGGRCVFIFEPLGHNPVIAAFRGALNSRRQWIDESLLFLGALEQFAQPFSSYRVRYYNLLGYGAKILPRHPVWNRIPEFLRFLDLKLFEKWPSLQKHAANFNVFYRK